MPCYALIHERMETLLVASPEFLFQNLNFLPKIPKKSSQWDLSHSFVDPSTSIFFSQLSKLSIFSDDLLLNRPRPSAFLQATRPLRKRLPF